MNIRDRGFTVSTSFFFQVLDIIRNTINDKRVKLSILNSFDPLPISPHDESNFGYQILQRTIHSVFSGVPVVPGMVFLLDNKFNMW